MSHRKMHLALSLVLTLCGLLNSIFCETQPNPKRDPHPVSSRKTSPPSHEADTDHEAFAYKLFEALSVEYHRKNLIFSPESISTALAMLSLGTRSTTLSNLVAGLGFDLQRIRAWEVHTSFQRLVQTLNELDRQRHLKHRDFLFIDINRRIKPKFLQETERLYEVEAQVADFRHRGIAKEQINQFVAQRLAHRIEEVVTSLHPHTFLFLLNYIFFKGKVYEVHENPFWVTLAPVFSKRCKSENMHFLVIISHFLIDQEIQNFIIDFDFTVLSSIFKVFASQDSQPYCLPYLRYFKVKCSDPCW